MKGERQKQRNVTSKKITAEQQQIFQKNFSATFARFGPIRSLHCAKDYVSVCIFTRHAPFSEFFPEVCVIRLKRFICDSINIL